MTKEQNALLLLLRGQLTGETPDLPEDTDWETVAETALTHGVAPMVHAAAQALDLPIPDKQKKSLFVAYQHAIFRDIQYRQTAQQVSDLLEREKIPHIFLKGIRLKENYPLSSFRTMSDLDILVHREDFHAIHDLMRDLDAAVIHRDGNHRSYRFPEGLFIEYHPDMIHCDSPVGTGINPGWQYAREQRSGRMELTEEGFYLNVMCHLANHFAAGGVGIRFIMDVWVCRHLRQEPLCRETVEEELRRFGLLEFSRNVEALAECWFSGEPVTDLLDEMGEYVFSSRSHGTQEREILNAASLSEKRSGFSALWSKAFHSREEMENRYPWLAGRPYLMPAAWTARAFRAIRLHGSEIAQWGKSAAELTPQEIAAQKEKLRRFGIERNSQNEHE